MLKILGTLFLSVFISTSVYAGEQSTESVPGEYVLKLSIKVSDYSKDDLETLLNSKIKTVIPDLNIVVVNRAIVELETFVLKELSDNEIIEVAEPNYIYHTTVTADDPSFKLQWGMKNFGQEAIPTETQTSPAVIGLAGVDIGIEKAWEIQRGSKDIIVAIIDTGVDYNHPDLAANMWVNEVERDGLPGVDDDKNGFIDDIHGYSFDGKTTDPKDDNGHGTHCAGVIAAQPNNLSGIAGVNWNVKIMPVKFLDSSGGGSLENAIKAIDYAIKMGAVILSNSWGGGGASDNLRAAIQRSSDAGLLFVAAAGNDGQNNDTSGGHFPSSYDVANILSVAAVTNRGELATYSNYGKKLVDVAAPGSNIYSTYIGNTYKSLSGTSMATPYVTGIAALLLAQEPQLRSGDIINRLVQTSVPLVPLSGKVKSNGIVNAYNALTNTIVPPDPNDPSQWGKKTISVSSAHPYAKNVSETFEIKIEGAKEMALFFNLFDTEKKYDTVSIYDISGKLVAQLSGSLDETFSPVIPGSYAKIVFQSDNSVEKNGFDITYVSFR